MPKESWVVWLLVAVVALLAYDRFVKPINFKSSTPVATNSVPTVKTMDQLAMEAITADQL